MTQLKVNESQIKNCLTELIFEQFFFSQLTLVIKTPPLRSRNY